MRFTILASRLTISDCRQVNWQMNWQQAKRQQRPQSDLSSRKDRDKIEKQTKLLDLKLQILSDNYYLTGLRKSIILRSIQLLS